MSKYLQVITTAERREDVERIARTVVEERLAACAQILGPISSVYWWKGAVEEAEEWILRHTPESVAPRLKLPCTENGAGCPPHCQDCAVGRAG